MVCDGKPHVHKVRVNAMDGKFSLGQLLSVDSCYLSTLLRRARAGCSHGERRRGTLRMGR